MASGVESQQRGTHRVSESASTHRAPVAVACGSAALSNRSAAERGCVPDDTYQQRKRAHSAPAAVAESLSLSAYESACLRVQRSRCRFSGLRIRRAPCGYTSALPIPTTTMLGKPSRSCATCAIDEIAAVMIRMAGAWCACGYQRVGTRRTGADGQTAKSNQLDAPVASAARWKNSATSSIGQCWRPGGHVSAALIAEFAKLLAGTCGAL